MNSTTPARPLFTLGDRLVDLERRRVSSLSGDMPLTAAEAALLDALLRAGGAPVEKSALTSEVLGFSPRARTRTLDTLLWRVRAKIEADPADPRHLVTLRHRGLALIGAVAIETRTTPALVGRGSERTRLGEWISRPGIFQVTGPGGYGKTALKRALAHDASHLFASAGGVHTLDLASVPGLASLPTALAARLGMDPRAAGELTSAFAARGDTLLLLDGVETMAGPAFTAFVEDLVGGAPALRIGLFSRVVVTTSGAERHLELKPLEPVAARSLMHARLTGHTIDAPRIDVALAATGGIPMAIELAAGDLRSGHAVDPVLLAAGLDAVLERSWNHLPKGARSDLVTLAAMVDPFDVHRVSSLLSVGLGDGVDALEVLRRHSVVHAEPSGYFSILESVRLLARRNEPDLFAGALLQHARLVARLASGSRTSVYWQFARQSTRELSQVLSVLEHDGEPASRLGHAQIVLAVLPLVTHSGTLAVADFECHLAVASKRVGADVSPDLSERLMACAAELALHVDDVERAEAILAGRVFSRARVETLALRARIAIVRGAEGTLVRELEDTIATLDSDSAERAELLGRLGALHGRFGRMALAASTLEACLASPDSTRWPGLDVEVRQQLATAHIITRPGQPGPERLFAEALMLAERAGLRRYVPVIVANRTTFHYLAGDDEAASASAHEALLLARRSGRAVVVAQALVAVAGIALRRGDHNGARTALAQAASHAASDTQQLEQIAHLETLLALVAGDLAMAASAVERVGTLGERRPLDTLVALHRGLIAWLQFQQDEALAHIANARMRATGVGRADVDLAIELAEILVQHAPERADPPALPPALYRRYQRLLARSGQVGMAGEQLRFLICRFGVRD